MILLLKVFAEIAFFRRGPEDLPASPFLFLTSLLAYAAGSILTSAVSTGEVTQIIFEALADVVLMLLWYGLLLAVYQRSARLPQTLTALFGTGALLYLVAFPVLNWLQQSLDGGTNTLIPFLLVLAVISWSIAVAGHIIHRALDIRFSLGLVICICYFFCSVTIFTFLFGAGPD